MRLLVLITVDQVEGQRTDSEPSLFIRRALKPEGDNFSDARTGVLNACEVPRAWGTLTRTS